MTDASPRAGPPSQWGGLSSAVGGGGAHPQQELEELVCKLVVGVERLDEHSERDGPVSDGGVPCVLLRHFVEQDFDLPASGWVSVLRASRAVRCQVPQGPFAVGAMHDVTASVSYEGHVGTQAVGVEVRSVGRRRCREPPHPSSFLTSSQPTHSPIPHTRTRTHAHAHAHVPFTP